MSSSRRRECKNHAVPRFCSTHGRDVNVWTFPVLPLQKGGHAPGAPCMSAEKHGSCDVWMDARMLAWMLARLEDDADTVQALQSVYCLTICLVCAIVLYWSNLGQTVGIYPSFSAVAGRETRPSPSQCYYCIAVNDHRVI